MKCPPVERPLNPALRAAWWESWVRFVRENPGLMDRVEFNQYYWGEHLFIGCETHKNLFRTSRAVGVKAPGFTDAIEYEELIDLRTWRETKRAPLLLHEGLLPEHCYLSGPTGSGKTSLGLASIFIQLIRGSQTDG